MTLKKLGYFLTALLMMTLSGCGPSGSRAEGPWNIVPNCTRLATTPTTAALLNNPYHNGYRLKTETFDNSVYHRVMNYDYEPSSSMIVGKRTDRRSSSDFVSFVETEQNLDAWGRVVGGVWSNRGGSLRLGYSYQTTYNDIGRMTSFGGGDAPTEFRYENNRLASIYDVNQGGAIAELTYDDESHLVSYRHIAIDLDHYYSCNDQNQITDIYLERDQIRNGRYELEYDENGNVSTLRSILNSGEVLSTYTYEYEAVEQPIFNHMVMRLEFGLLGLAYDYVH